MIPSDHGLLVRLANADAARAAHARLGERGETVLPEDLLCQDARVAAPPR